MPDVPSVVHLIEVNFASGAVLASLFCPLRVLNVLPHVMRLNDPVRNGVHGLRVGFPKMAVHLGEKEPQAFEGLFLRTGKSLNSVPVADEGALVDPVAFRFLVRHLHAGHGLDQRGDVEVFLLVGERKAFSFGRFPGTFVVGLVLLGDLRAAGGIASPLGFSVPQEVKDFVPETGDILL